MLPEYLVLSIMSDFLLFQNKKTFNIGRTRFVIKRSMHNDFPCAVVFIYIYVFVIMCVLCTVVSVKLIVHRERVWFCGGTDGDPLLTLLRLLGLV